MRAGDGAYSTWPPTAMGIAMRTAALFASGATLSERATSAVRVTGGEPQAASNKASAAAPMAGALRRIRAGVETARSWVIGILRLVRGAMRMVTRPGSPPAGQCVAAVGQPQHPGPCHWPQVLHTA